MDTDDYFLKHLTSRRVQVSLGHCNASYERAAAAVAAGAAAVTHMFNCCSSLSNRNPGYTGLLPPPFTCAIGLIADGVHVHDASLRTACCCAGDRVSLVTDAIAAAGLEDGNHCIAGQSITVNHNRAVVAATGVLVGQPLVQRVCQCVTACAGGQHRNHGCMRATLRGGYWTVASRRCCLRQRCCCAAAGVGGKEGRIGRGL